MAFGPDVPLLRIAIGCVRMHYGNNITFKYNIFIFNYSVRAAQLKKYTINCYVNGLEKSDKDII